MAKYDINLRDYWRIIRKRRNIVILTTIIFAVVSYLFALFSAPGPLYRATSAVKVEKATDLTSMLLGTVSWTSWDNVATQAVIITSFPVMEKAARQMGLIPADLSTEEIRRNNKYLGVVNALKSKVETAQEGNTNIINITSSSATPQEAALLANTVAEVFRQSNVEERNKKVRETREFIEKQLGVVQGRLEESEQSLRGFKERTKLVALDTQTEAALVRLTGLEDGISRLQHRRLEIQQHLGLLRQLRAGEHVSQEALYVEKPPTELAKLLAKFRDLSLRRKLLLNEYTDEHPEVKELDAELGNVLSEMENELTSILSTMDIRLNDLRKSLQAVRAQTMTIPESALSLARLQRDVDVNADLLSQLKSKYQEAMIQESGLVEEVRIVKPALEPTQPINKSTTLLNTFVGGLIGLVLGLVLALIVETMDTSLSTIEDVEEILEIPVLGVIPSTEEFSAKERTDKEDRSRTEPLVTHFAPRTPVAEAYRSLRTNLQFIRKDKQAKTFLVTSASLQEGKTYNVVNLSLSLAQAGMKVLLLDADLRRPSVHQVFGIERHPGLTDYIMGISDLKPHGENEVGLELSDLLENGRPNGSWRCVTNTITDLMLGRFDVEDILRTPGLDSLHIISAGQSFLNPAEILRSPRFKEFLGEVKEFYDVVIVDTPPVLPVADAFEVAPEVDGIILVYEVGRIGRGIVNRAKVQMENVNANVLGVILNNVKPEVAPDFYRYRTDYYYEQKSEPEVSGKFSRWYRQIKNKDRGDGSSGKGLKPSQKENRLKKLSYAAVVALFLLAGVVWLNYPVIRSRLSDFPGVKTKAVIGPISESKPESGLPSGSPTAKQMGAIRASVPGPTGGLSEQPTATKSVKTAGLATSTPETARDLSPAQEPSASAATEQVVAIRATVSEPTGEISEQPTPAESVKTSEANATPAPSTAANELSSTEEPIFMPPRVAGKLIFAPEPVSSKLGAYQFCETRVPLAKIRSTPDLDAAVLQKIPQGRKIRVTGIEGDWLRLQLRNGDTGWIYHSLVQPIREPAEKPVTALSDLTGSVPTSAQPDVDKQATLAEEVHSSLKSVLQICEVMSPLAKIRSRPDIHSTVSQRVRQGTRLNVVNRDGNWLKLKLRNGGTGWIYHSLVQPIREPAEKPVTALSDLTDSVPTSAQPDVDKQATLAEEVHSSLKSVLQICEVMSPLAKIRSRPDIHSTVLQRVRQGTRLQTIRREGDWLKLKLKNGGTGWIYHSLVQEVEFTPPPSPTQVNTESEETVQPLAGQG